MVAQPLFRNDWNAEAGTSRVTVAVCPGATSTGAKAASCAGGSPAAFGNVR